MKSPYSIFRILPLYVVIFFGFVGYSLMITLFTPLFMYAQDPIISSETSLSYRIILLGVVVTLFPMAQFFSSPILGALSDRFGRRPILLISLYIVPICYALIAYALTIHSMALLMAATLLEGISQANIVIAQSAIADIAPPKERVRLFGYIYLSVSLAFVVGPLLGGKLADPSYVHWFQYPTPFWAVSILLVLTLIWTQCSFRETKIEKENHITFKHALTNLLTIFTSRRLRLIYLINFLLYFSIFGFCRCYPMYIVKVFHVTVSKLSEYIAWVSVPIILVNLGVLGSLAKRFSPRIIALWSAFFTGLFMLTIIIPSSPNVLWLTLFLTSFAFALALPACGAMLSLEALPEQQGRVMGNNQSLQVAAEALSALLAGLIAAITIQMSMIVMASFAIITSAIILLSTRK